MINVVTVINTLIEGKIKGSFLYISDRRKSSKKSVVTKVRERLRRVVSKEFHTQGLFFFFSTPHLNLDIQK